MAISTVAHREEYVPLSGGPTLGRYTSRMLEMWHHSTDDNSVLADIPTDGSGWVFNPTVTYKQCIPRKPHGFWLAVPTLSGDAWQDYCKSADYGPPMSWRHRVLVDPTRLLVLNERKDLSDEWLKPPPIPDFLIADKYDTPIPYWETIAELYDGVMFPDYKKDKSERYGWWNFIDLSSACVWNLDCVISTGIEELVSMNKTQSWQ